MQSLRNQNYTFQFEFSTNKKALLTKIKELRDESSLVNGEKLNMSACSPIIGFRMGLPFQFTLVHLVLKIYNFSVL